MTNPSLFFATPVWASKIENYKTVNEEIYKYIINLQQSDKDGIIKSNIKGWHSKDFNLNDKEALRFVKLITPSIEKVINHMNWDTTKQIAKITSMWAIINKGGASNARHHHGNR